MMYSIYLSFLLGNGPDNLLNNYNTYMSDPPSYTSNPPSLRRSNERLIPSHADERTHLDPSPQQQPGGLTVPGAPSGGLTPTAPPPSYDEAMQAAVPTAPPAPSPQSLHSPGGLQPNSGGVSSSPLFSPLFSVFFKCYLTQTKSPKLPCVILHCLICGSTVSIAVIIPIL